jgi:CBS domain-containing protein
MKDKLVKDLMIPVSEYATVHQDATLVEAIETLEKARQKNSNGKEQIRAVLVVDNNQKIIGKIGHLAFVQALEPKYGTVKDIDKLAAANLSPEFIESIMDHFNLWQDSFYDVCQKAQSIKAKDAMRTVTESIDENTSLIEAMHKIIMWQSLSILVTRKDDIVGILRLSDIFNEIVNYLRNNCTMNK